MVNDWLRLWHELPNDPKWRTISKVSGQRIGDVISIYIHLLVEASNATERGRTHPNAEDLASALDIGILDVEAILAAMQGRVIDGDNLSGWNTRQPKREDNSADRSRLWREEQKRTQPNSTELKVTLDKRREESDTEELYIDFPLTPQGDEEQKDHIVEPNKLIPTIEQVVSYFSSRLMDNALGTERGTKFWQWYESKKWMQRGDPIAKWTALADSWIADIRKQAANKPNVTTRAGPKPNQTIQELGRTVQQERQQLREQRGET